MITTTTVGEADGLTDLLETDPRFEHGTAADPQLIQLGVITGADSLDAVRAAVDGPSTLLAHPGLLADTALAEQLRSRGAPVVWALTARHERAVQSSLAAVAAGRLGLPWNIQADLVLATDVPTDLVAVASDPLDVVLRTLRLPVTEVLARCHTVSAGAAGHATVQCRHRNGVTSTAVVGAIPGSENDASEVVRHRYRVSGSHGELVIDATNPALTVRTARGTARRWSAPSADRTLIDGVATQLDGGPALTPPGTVDELVAVLAAARESIASGQPVALHGA